MVKNLLASTGDLRLAFDPWVRKIPGRRAWQPTPVFLPGASMDRGARQVTVHGPAELDMAEETWHAHTCMLVNDPE